MAIALHQIASDLYLVAGLIAGLGLALTAPGLLRLGPGFLLAGALVHAAAFATLHQLTPTPALTDLPMALSFSAWIAVLFAIALQWRVRMGALSAMVGPLAFIAAFAAALFLGGERANALPGDAGGSWPHLHVLLASAGLAMLGIAGLIGVVFLAEHRRLKHKRRMSGQLPSLEALDRANRAALALGFPLLTLGVASGILWVWASGSDLWSGGAHEIGSLVAWAIYAALVVARFGLHQGSRRAAQSAVAGFAILFVAAIGFELFS
jgi:ABC-type uncharacterized transport system permease subunit